MTLDEYQNEAKRTAPRSLDAYPVSVATAFLELRHGPTGDELLKIFDTLIWGQGLAGEAGEVCDLLKKVHGHGQPYDGEKLKKELGDCLWYLANLAGAHGFTLSEVAQANVSKLRARYPSGFSVAAAQAKADELCREFRNGREHFFCLKNRGHFGDHAASDGDGSLLCWPQGESQPKADET